MGPARKGNSADGACRGKNVGGVPPEGCSARAMRGSPAAGYLAWERGAGGKKKVQVAGEEGPDLRKKNENSRIVSSRAPGEEGPVVIGHPLSQAMLQGCKVNSSARHVQEKKDGYPLMILS